MSDTKPPEVQVLPPTTVGVVAYILKIIANVTTERFAFYVVCGGFMWLGYSWVQTQADREVKTLKQQEAVIEIVRKGCVEDMKHLIGSMDNERHDRIEAEAKQRERDRTERAQERMEFSRWREMLGPILKKGLQHDQPTSDMFGIGAAPMPKIKGVP